MAHRGQVQPIVNVVVCLPGVIPAGDDFFSGNNRINERRHRVADRRERFSSSDRSGSGRRERSRSRSGHSDEREHGHRWERNRGVRGQGRYDGSNRRNQHVGGGNGQWLEDDHRRWRTSTDHQQGNRDRGEYNQRGRQYGNQGSFPRVRAPSSGNWRDNLDQRQGLRQGRPQNLQSQHFWPRGGGVRLGGWGSRAQAVDRILQQAVSVTVSFEPGRPTTSRPIELIDLTNDEEVVQRAPNVPHARASPGNTEDLELIDISDDEEVVQRAPNVPHARASPGNTEDLELIDISDDELPIQATPGVPNSRNLPGSSSTHPVDVELFRDHPFIAHNNELTVPRPRGVPMTEAENREFLDEWMEILNQVGREDEEAARLRAQGQIPTVPVNEPIEPEVMTSPSPARHQERDPESGSGEDIRRAADRAGMRAALEREPLEDGEIEDEVERTVDRAGMRAASRWEPSGEERVCSPGHGNFRNRILPPLASPPPTHQWEREVEAGSGEPIWGAAERSGTRAASRWEPSGEERVGSPDNRRTTPTPSLYGEEDIPCYQEEVVGGSSQIQVASVTTQNQEDEMEEQPNDEEQNNDEDLLQMSPIRRLLPSRSQNSARSSDSQRSTRSSVTQNSTRSSLSQGGPVLRSRSRK